MNIGIGTVQFGLDYGVSNIGGVTPSGEVRKILEVAAAKGISIVDTASMYGTSEIVLGDSWPAGHSFNVVTKTPRLNISQAPEILESTLLRSLERLKTSTVYGLLVHNADDILEENGPDIISCLKKAKERGLVKKIGVSVYDGRQIDAVLELFFPDLVQLPINVFDQRLLKSGHLFRLKELGIEIHARSAFLQGLLLMPPDNVPEYFSEIVPTIINYHAALLSAGMSPVQGALNFIQSVPYIDTVVCGVNNSVQLEELCSALSGCPQMDYSAFAISDEKYINPSLWSMNS